MILVLFGFLASCALGRTRQKTLLDITDRLTILNKEDGAILDVIDLRQFPYVMAVS